MRNVVVEMLMSSCHGATVHQGEALAGSAHNWVCDECHCACHAIKAADAAKLLEKLQYLLRFPVALQNPGFAQECRDLVDKIIGQ